MKSRSVVLFAVHGEDFVVATAEYSLSRSHEKAAVNFDFLVAQKRRKFLGMNPDGLVCLVKDRKIEIYACLSCRSSKFIAALIGRECDHGSVGASTKQRRDFIYISMCWEPQIIDFADKLIALKIAD